MTKREIIRYYPQVIHKDPFCPVAGTTISKVGFIGNKKFLSLRGKRVCSGCHNLVPVSGIEPLT